MKAFDVGQQIVDTIGRNLRILGDFREVHKHMNEEEERERVNTTQTHKQEKTTTLHHDAPRLPKLLR